MARRKRLDPASFSSGAGSDDPKLSEANRHVSDESHMALPSLRRERGLSAAPPIARVAAESAAEAALSEISEAMARARAEGRLVLRLKLDEIEADHLVRDRIGLDEEELAGLVASIFEHGQRSPIEVSEIAPGRYGLISGWRRLAALRRLSEGGDARFGYVLALVRQPDNAADAYIAMVEENEIRLGLSYYERARIAARAVEQGVFENEREALRRLFANASRSRRSKIGSFLVLYHQLDGVLRFPEMISERLGLALEKRLQDEDFAVLETFLAELRRDAPEDQAAEMARLQAFAALSGPAPEVGRAENVSRAKHSGVPPARDILSEGAASKGRELRPGLFLTTGKTRGAASLTLSGPGVDPVFLAKLESWLKAES